MTSLRKEYETFKANTGSKKSFAEFKKLWHRANKYSALVS